MAFLLDTNVISELRRGENAAPNVWAWRRSITYEDIFISVLVLGELRRGVESKRGKDPTAATVFERWLREVKAAHRHRILPLTEEICDVWGRMAAGAKIPVIDGLIAATAACHGLTVATRNESDFQRVGVDYINPFRPSIP